MIVNDRQSIRIVSPIFLFYLSSGCYNSENYSSSFQHLSELACYNAWANVNVRVISNSEPICTSYYNNSPYNVELTEGIRHRDKSGTYYNKPIVK